MNKIKPRYKYWAAQPILTLQEGAQLIATMEPDPKIAALFEQTRPRLERGEAIRVPKELEKACQTHADLHRYFMNQGATIRTMVCGGGKLAPLEIVNAASAMGICNKDNEFVIAVKKSVPKPPKALPEKNQQRTRRTQKCAPAERTAQHPNGIGHHGNIAFSRLSKTEQRGETQCVPNKRNH